MSRERFTTQESPFIRVDSCDGNLIVRGWAESSLEIKGEFQTHDSDKGFLITSQGDLYLFVPGDAVLSVGKVGGNLTVRNATGSGAYEYVQGDAVIVRSGDADMGTVHGDLVAKQLIGSLSAAEVNGDVVVRAARELFLTEVHGDLSARLIDGNVTIEGINGDADLRMINGDVVIQQCFRDVNLRNVNGLATVEGVLGDIRLRGGLPGGDHSLAARGDIVVRWPVGLPINLNISAAKIDNRLPLEDIAEKKGSLAGRVGQSDTNLTLASDGRVIVRKSDPEHDKGAQYDGDMGFDVDLEFDGIAARIEAEVNNHLSRITHDLETKFGGDIGRRFSEKMARKGDKAAERARRRTEPRQRTSGFDYGFSAPPPPKKTVSIEEQLKILKMVEDGKISPEEAGMLLEALEA